MRRNPRRRGGVRRVVDLVLAVAILALLALVTARYQGWQDRTLTGVPRIADGDSLELGGTRIRLSGIDGPELGQTCTRDGSAYACGQMARDMLARLAARRIVCEGWERDRYGRLLARCRAGSIDVNAAMVSEGWAVAYGGYRDEERAAREAGRGLWAGSFERPQARRVHGGLAESEHDWLASIARFFAGLFGGRDFGD
jgi:endonuclease YncB( thermonuclease family)